MRFIKFTEEEKQSANEVNLVDYLKSINEDMYIRGNTYFLKNINGVSVIDNKWYDHYNKKGGLAVTFLKEFYGYSYTQAVVELLGEKNIKSLQKNKSQKVINRNNSTKNVNNVEETKTFTLPHIANNNEIAYNYLLKKRFLKEEVLDYFFSNNLIYQSKDYNNVVFIGTDEKKQPKFACAKGTCNKNFSQTIKNSNSDYSFNYTNAKAETLFVFESPIDMLSLISEFEMWRDFNYIALDGITSKPLLHFLKNNKNITEIYLCLDNDVAGIEGNQKLTEELIKHKYDLNRIHIFQSKYKDWNEDLKAKNGIEPKPVVAHPKIEAYQKKIDKLLFFYEENMKDTEENVSLKYSEFVKEYKNKTFEENEEILESVVNDVVYILKKYLAEIGKNVDEENVLNVFFEQYKAYEDKGRIETKISKLNELMKDFNSSRQKGTNSKDEKVTLIKNMMKIADMCIRINIKLEDLHTKELESVENQQTMSF